MITLIKTLTATELKIWLYIYTLKNENNITFKTASDLMEDLDISHRTIYKSLVRLRELKLIDVQGSKRLIKVLEEPK
jgi:Mn-dependent DtxR family transcriptional regulator